MTTSAEIVQYIGGMLKTALQRVPVYVWCDDCECIAPIAKRRVRMRLKEHRGCCGRELLAHNHPDDYAGSN